MLLWECRAPSIRLVDRSPREPDAWRIRAPVVENGSLEETIREGGECHRGHQRYVPRQRHHESEMEEVHAVCPLSEPGEDAVAEYRVPAGERSEHDQGSRHRHQRLGPEDDRLHEGTC